MHPLDLSRLPARLVVTGAGGQLGSQLCRRLGSRALPLDMDQLDLTAPDPVRRTLEQLRPAAVINTAAYTAVDRAEDDAARCFAVNTEAVQTLAEVTRRIGCPLVQISTDYVFGGIAAAAARPLTEDDPPSPQGIYAQSKLAGELAARHNPAHLIVRTSGVYGAPGPTSTTNFVMTMLRLGRERDQVRVVSDQICSPTWAVELAEAVLHLLAERQIGLFHVVSRGGTSWCELAQTIFRLASIDCHVEPITTEQYGAKAPRPRYSVLDTTRYQQTAGPPLSRWDEAVAKFLQTLE